MHEIGADDMMPSVKRLRFVLVTTSVLVLIALCRLGRSPSPSAWTLNPNGNPAYSVMISGWSLTFERSLHSSPSIFSIPENGRNRFSMLGLQVKTWDDIELERGPQSWSMSKDGINVNVVSAGPPEHQTEIIVPLWWVIVILALLPIGLILEDFRRQRRRKPGTCFNCGYDLRASTERCPECGKAIPPSLGNRPERDDRSWPIRGAHLHVAAFAKPQAADRSPPSPVLRL